MENQRHTFTVDELELVSFLREGKGALEAEVEVDWDPARWLKHLILIITARRQNDCCLIRFAMKESTEQRLAIEERWGNSIYVQTKT